MDATDDDLPQELFAFFEAMPRQGPGSPAVTRNLLRRLRSLLPAHPVAADMGCGNGAAGLVLADEGVSVTGVDIHQPFLDSFEQSAAAKGCSDRVSTRRASMTESGLAPDSLDLIWSEGAVYIVGFDVALEIFWPLLKPGSLLVVSECVWLQEQVPEKLRAFWDRGYPAMRTVGGNIRAGEQEGYRFHHCELLPSEVWETDFYRPMEAMIDRLGPNSSPAMQAIIDGQHEEIALFRQYNHLYGYVFHVFVRP
jgi:serine/threonine-protein kinase HipA